MTLKSWSFLDTWITRYWSWRWCWCLIEAMLDQLYIGPPVLSHGTLLRVQGLTVNCESRIQRLATLPKRVPGHYSSSQTMSLSLHQRQLHFLVFIQFNCCFQDKWANNFWKIAKTIPQSLAHLPSLQNYEYSALTTCNTWSTRDNLWTSFLIYVI